GCLLGTTCTRFGAQSKQVRGSPVEIQGAAVDELALEEAMGVPAREIRIVQIGDLRAQAFLERRCVEGELEEDPTHALALEFERLARVPVQRRLRQRLADDALGGLELAEIDAGDDAVDGLLSCLARGLHKQHGEQQDEPTAYSSSPSGARQ